MILSDLLNVSLYFRLIPQFDLDTCGGPGAKFNNFRLDFSCELCLLFFPGTRYARTGA